MVEVWAFVAIREECEVITLIIANNSYYINSIYKFRYYTILVRLHHIFIFIKGGSLCMRPHKESVMEKPEPTSKYEEEPVGWVQYTKIPYSVYTIYGIRL